MRGRRHLLLLLATLALGSVGVVSARAVDAPPQALVTVTLPGGAAGQPIALALADFAGREDVRDARYDVRDADGATSEVTVVAGFSLKLLLQEAGVDLDDLTYLEVPRADGTSVLVLREQLVEDDGDQPPPVVWVDADGTHFLRPSAGEDDVNADDVVTPPDGTIAVQLKDGQPFAVRIDASARRVRPRQPVRFKAVLVAGTRTADMSFDWYFADGSANAQGERVTHRFARGGTYLVQVNVVKSGRTLDAHDIQVVRVRAAARHDAAGGGAGDGGSGGSGGGGAGGEEDSGATGTGTEGGGSGASGGGTGATGGAGSGTSGAGGGTSSSVSSQRSRPPRRDSAPPASSVFSAPRGELVSGTLLASADAVPLPTGASGPSGRARGATEDQPLRIPVGVWIAAGLAVLLAVGWTFEARHIPPFLQP